MAHRRIFQVRFARRIWIQFRSWTSIDILDSDCVFKIHPRYKYDSQKALNDQLSRLGRDRSTINKEDVDLEIAALPNNNEEEELIQTLLTNEESEKTENFAEFQRMAGKNVQYGQSVQLIHAKSGKFLTVTVKEFAELEKDCLRVILDADGNEGSWYVGSSSHVYFVTVF